MMIYNNIICVRAFVTTTTRLHTSHETYKYEINIYYMMCQKTKKNPKNKKDMDLGSLGSLSSPSVDMTPEHLNDLNRALLLINDRHAVLRESLKERPLSFRIIKYNRWGASLKRTITIDAKEKRKEAIVFDKTSSSSSSSSDEKRFAIEDIAAISTFLSLTLTHTR
jgi:hypothetical protein